MGRHADPDPSAFWRSLGASVGRAVAVIAVGVLIAVGIVSVTGDDEPDGVAASAQSTGKGSEADDPASPEADASDIVAGSTALPLPPDPERAQPDPTAPPTPAPTPAPSATPDPAGAEAIAAAPPPAETTVQVLDGVGGDGRQARAAVERLQELGYNVVVINPAGSDYATTEVQFTPGHDAAARALAARDPRFSTIGPTSTLSHEVHLHVIVGADFTG